MRVSLPELQTSTPPVTGDVNFRTPNGWTLSLPAAVVTGVIVVVGKFWPTATDAGVAELKARQAKAELAEEEFRADIRREFRALNERIDITSTRLSTVEVRLTELERQLKAKNP